MSETIARTYTHVSNRARARQDVGCKVVFKSVLDNPFRIRWYDSGHVPKLCHSSPLYHRPSVPVNVQNRFLALLMDLADGVPEYRQVWTRENRQRKRIARDAHLKSANMSKEMLVSGISIQATEADDLGGSMAMPGGEEFSEVTIGDASAIEVEAKDQAQLKPPPILQHLTIGINAVTRKLESQIKSSRQTVIVSDRCSVSSQYSLQPRVKVIFVCRADIDPPILVDHLPHLISACNSLRKPPDFVKLVPLPKGAEFALAAALGLRRVAVIAVDVIHLFIQTIAFTNWPTDFFQSTTPELSSCDSLLESVPTLSAPWLLPPQQSSSRRTEDLVPTHIKQVRTSAPKDMKAAREQRVKGRAAAKEKMKEKIKNRRKLTRHSKPG
jgi:ribonuclease P/MRP protein subunit POP3